MDCIDCIRFPSAASLFPLATAGKPVNDIIMQFKEIAFVRLRRDPKVSSVSVDNLMRLRMQELKAALRGLLEWSFHVERCELRETYLNYENKAIYNNGVVVRRQQSGDYMVEIVTSVPRDACAATLATAFAQPKNHLNYTYEQAAFQANPVPFFESLGYKIQSSFEYKQVEYFRSLALGIEVIVYPKHAYLQITESYGYRPEVENLGSAGNQLLRLLAPFLDESSEVILSSGNMKPLDFMQEYS